MSLSSQLGNQFFSRDWIRWEEKGNLDIQVKKKNLGKIKHQGSKIPTPKLRKTREQTKRTTLKKIPRLPSKSPVSSPEYNNLRRCPELEGRNLNPHSGSTGENSKRSREVPLSPTAQQASQRRTIQPARQTQRRRRV